MNTSLLSASPSANMKWPVVRLSRKVVRDFQQHNILPAFTPRQQQIDDKVTEPKATTSKQMKTRNTNGRSDNRLNKFNSNDMKFDADIQDSGKMQPMIILDRIAEPQALTVEHAEPSTSGKKKTTPPPKNAAKKPKKIGRPAFVLPQTRSKKN